MRIVGIAGNDAESRRVAKWLRKKPAIPLFIFQHYPRKRKITLGFEKYSYSLTDKIDPSSFRALLLRSQSDLFLPLGVMLPSPRKWKKIYRHYEEYFHSEFEKLSQRYSLVRALEKSIVVVNGIDSLNYHWQKPYQLFLLKKNGIPVPEFVCSNDVRALEYFIRKSPNRSVVYKTLSGIAEARIIDLSYFRQHKGSLKFEPILVQRIATGTNFRVYVLDGEVVAAGELDHQGFDSGTRLKSIKPIDLPGGIRDTVVRAARVLKMRFTGVDMIYDKSSEELNVLECNDPAGFVAFEDMTHIPLSRMLADYLADASP